MAIDPKKQKENEENKSHLDALPLVDNGIVTSPVSKTSILSKLKHKLVFIPLIVFIFAVGGFVGLYFQPPGLQFVMSILGLSPGGGTSNPIATSPKQQKELGPTIAIESITALGTLLPLQDISILAPPFGANDARIAVLNVQEGDAVIKGQTIAVMDNLATLEADLHVSQADVQFAEAQLSQIKLSAFNNRQKALAEVERIQANDKQALSDLKRGKELIKTGVITQSELDKLVSSESSTNRSLDGAKANFANFDFTNIEDQVDVKVAASNLFTTTSKLKAKQQNLESATVKAPNDGVIISIHSRIGERPGTQGIATFGNTKKMQAKLEVYQSDIQFLRLGSKVSMRSEALGDKILQGEISRIGLEVKQQQLIAKSPAANTDARVVIVNVELNPHSTLVASTLNGLEVIATIEVQSY